MGRRTDQKLIKETAKSRRATGNTVRKAASRSAERGRSTSVRQGFRGGRVSCEGDTPDRVDR
jgi:hypothetical protein